MDASEDIETELIMSPRTEESAIVSADGKRVYNDFPISKTVVIVLQKILTESTISTTNVALVSSVGVLGIVSFQSVTLIIKLI